MLSIPALFLVISCSSGSSSDKNDIIPDSGEAISGIINFPTINGFVLESSTSYSADGSVSSVTNFELDAAARQIKVRTGNSAEANAFMNFDENGNLASEQFNNGEGKILAIHDYSYLDNGLLGSVAIGGIYEGVHVDYFYKESMNLYRILTTYPTPEDIDDYYDLTYHSNGLLDTIQHTKGREPTELFTYSVNSESGRIELKTRGDGTRVEYRYDSNENLTERLQFDVSGELASRVEYSYTQSAEPFANLNLVKHDYRPLDY